jgi:YGGT family
MDSYVAPSTKPLYRGTQIVWYVLGVLEAILLFRFLLRLFGANPAAGFTDIIYTLSYPFVLPFQAVFSATRVSGSVFEWTTLLAMLVYWLLAIGILRLLVMSKSVSTPEAAAKLEVQE